MFPDEKKKERINIDRSPIIFTVNKYYKIFSEDYISFEISHLLPFFPEGFLPRKANDGSI